MPEDQSSEQSVHSRQVHLPHFSVDLRLTGVSPQVEDGGFTAWPQHTMHLVQRADGIAKVLERRHAHHEVECGAGERHYVRDKDGLLVLLGDEIGGEIPLVNPSGSWHGQLKDMARNVRKGLLAQAKRRA